MTRPPTIECERLHPTLAVPDITEAVKFYVGKLGFTQGFVWGDPPSYAGLNIGDVSIHLSRGEPSRGLGVAFVVGNADELLAFHQANGVTIAEPAGDRDYGLRDYSVKDPWGYYLTFGHYIYGVGEPVPVERVDVPVRLEKRLAAVLTDLAAYKNMSVSSCLEETLLHTFEPLGDGVASPHTAAQLRKIQELKQRHGIDYDCHAGYRFVEP